MTQLDINGFADLEKLCETVDREVEFLFEGQGTGWYLTLRHESAEEVQEFMRRYNAKVRELALKRKTSAQQQLLDSHADELRVAHVASWRWEKGTDAAAGRPPFSKKELKAVLQRPGFGWHVREFIDQEVGSLEDFLARSEDSLPTASHGTPDTNSSGG